MAETKKVKEKKLKFEDAMKRLDEITSLLEQGNADLDSSLALYEEGVHLVRDCGRMLDEAEKRIKVLRAGENGMVEEELELDGEKNDG